MSGRRRAFLGGVAAALVALAAVLLAPRLAGRAGSGPEAVAQDRPGPVLLVAGYGGGTGGLNRLAAALRAAGRQTQIVPVVGNGTGDLRAQAGALQAAASAQLAAGAPSVDVIGYSAGGVVARIWAADLGGAGQARRIVTLGSPHNGTDVAALAATFAAGSCPAACRQLVPDSELLRGLPPTMPGPRWVSVWSTADEVVTPPDSARLRGAVNVPLQSVCPDARTGHGQLPADPLVVALVTRALSAQPLAEVPPAGQCAALRDGTAVSS